MCRQKNLANSVPVAGPDAENETGPHVLGRRKALAENDNANFGRTFPQPKTDQEDMQMTENIALIGFKSCGKTTVGRLVADALDYTFCDLDDTLERLIETQCGAPLTCREFYTAHGAEAFRQVETKAFHEHLDDTRTVLATGGGAPMTEANRKALSQFGIVCYIRARPEIIYARFQQNGMPAYLRDEPTLDKLTQIWTDRNAVYAPIADLTIEAGEMSPDQICTAILNELDGKKEPCPEAQ